MHRVHGIARQRCRPVVVACLWLYAVALPPSAWALPTIQYELADAHSGEVLSSVWGWVEEPEDGSAPVTAVSATTFAKGSQLSQRVVFTRETPPRCLSWESILRDKNGSVLVTNHTQWVAEVSPLLATAFPERTYPMEGMGYALTHLGLGREERTEIHTLFGATLAQVDLWLDGSETVRVPAGEFRCHRVRMRANAESLFPKLPAFLRPVLSFFIPTYTLWLTIEEPQRLVQFRGQMGPPGSPELLMRMMRVRDQPPMP
ncbi:MAG TPA: hypothetical protein VMW56_21195 [Candidatus Margulisiibacteriota bacterium]|nr:hypothetical protein [Candidatus Margulisiibacteriota bacterium]